MLCYTLPPYIGRLLAQDMQTHPTEYGETILDPTRPGMVGIIETEALLDQARQVGADEIQTAAMGVPEKELVVEMMELELKLSALGSRVLFLCNHDAILVSPF